MAGPRSGTGRRTMKANFFPAVALVLFGVACREADPPRTYEPAVDASTPSVPEVARPVATAVTVPAPMVAPVVSPAAPIASIASPVDASATATATPSATPPPKRPGSFPPVTNACSTAAECEMVFTTNGCCPQCPPRFGNKDWATNVRSFCAGADASHCKPGACSWGTAGPACKNGHCVEAGR